MFCNVCPDDLIMNSQRRKAEICSAAQIPNPQTNSQSTPTDFCEALPPLGSAKTLQQISNPKRRFRKQPDFLGNIKQKTKMQDRFLLLTDGLTFARRTQNPKPNPKTLHHAAVRRRGMETDPKTTREKSDLLTSLGFSIEKSKTAHRNLL